MSLSTVSPQQLSGASPTVSDDVYALGALLYDLLSGAPPLHPGITPERIRDEIPARLGVDGSGQPLPLALIQLVAALLEKSPARRPVGMAAVRAVLEDLLQDEGSQLRRMRGDSPALAEASPAVPQKLRSQRRRRLAGLAGLCRRAPAAGWSRRCAVRVAEAGQRTPGGSPAAARGCNTGTGTSAAPPATPAPEPTATPEPSPPPVAAEPAKKVPPPVPRIAASPPKPAAADKSAQEFERALSRGLNALAAGQLAEARQAIDRAVALRPQDPGAQNALAQLRAEERRERVATLQAEAQQLVARRAVAGSRRPI